ncbi:histidinol-phosphatase [Desertibacillus haloalkaliphilus]|uniref:histidinol-phosphatase n=1 Tax=Desertibacillus haloalkaliphilus TaxID=1328930 RepID=UPI001C2748B3|nr:histidinol-phosphatase [Desertibacillus haloalkaliphilus]MBU8908840.1 histidinol-phosphatase [Desertibacillus haloalkaliphilus]
MTVFDLHTHHERCGHAKGTIEDYITAAISNGLDVIGIADHSPYFHSKEDHPSPGVTMAKSQFNDYVNEVLTFKEKYRDKIDVLLGIECDYFPAHMESYRQAVRNIPFDYIIGSVHFVDDISIFKKGRWEGLTKEQKIKTKESYYSLIEQSARSGMFQVLGHIDAMKGFYPQFSEIETDVIDQTLQVIADHELVIEVNTSGKTKDSGGWYPSDEILERALFHNVSVTFGSDAHVPERVGDEFNIVTKRLKEIGYHEWVYFVDQKKVPVPI